VKWLAGLAVFAAGVAIGYAVTREGCINKIEAPINKLVGGLLPADSYAYGATVNAVDTFIRSN
jgi:hypothetical protein